MYLSKRKEIYYLYYQQLNGKMTCISTKTKYKSDALKFLSSFEATKREEKQIVILFKDLIFKFLKHSESIHKWNHSKTLRVTLNQASKYFGNPPIDSFTVMNLQEYIDYRMSKVSAYAVRRDFATFSNIFNYAIIHKYLTSNPIKDLRKPKVPEKQPLYFSNLEFNQFLLSIDNDDFRDLVMLAVNTGLRQMELLTLTKEQIDVIRGTITLDNRTHVTKSRKIRVIPLNERAKDILNTRIDNNETIS